MMSPPAATAAYDYLIIHTSLSAEYEMLCVSQKIKITEEGPRDGNLFTVPAVFSL